MPADIAHAPLPDVVAAYIRAYNAFDIAALAAVLSPDIEFKNIADGQETLSTAGKVAFVEAATAACEYFSQRQQTVRDTITVADVTLARIDYKATCAVDLPNGWRAGEQIALTGRSLFQLKDGLIIRLIDETGSTGA